MYQDEDDKRLRNRLFSLYGETILTYTYNNSKQLTSITFRGEKTITFTYTAGKMTAIGYHSNSYITSLSLSTSNSTVAHYSGVTYTLGYTADMRFRADAAVVDNSSTIIHSVMAEKTSSKTVTITRLIGNETVDTTAYEFPASTTSPGEKFNQVEITNNEGVKTRVQYEYGKPMYSYEIGDDAEFQYGRFAGTVQWLSSQGQPEQHNARGFQTWNDGLSMGNNSGNNWSTGTSGFGYQLGYYVISGWIRSVASACYGTTIGIQTSPGNSVAEHYVSLEPVNQWKYFSVVCHENPNQFIVSPTETGDEIETRDFRITFQNTGVLRADDSSHARLSGYVLRNDSTEIPFEYAEFYYMKNNQQTLIEHVTATDVLRYKMKKKRTGSCNEAYYDSCKGIITGVPDLKVKYNNANYSVSDFDVAKRTYANKDGYLTRMCINEGDTYSYIVVRNYVKGNLASTKKCNKNGDVVSVTENGVETTYTRTNTGLVTGEMVGNLCTRTTQYGADASGNPTVTVTDELGGRTAYTLDPVWGVVKSTMLPDNCVVTDTYDDDMCAMTKRSFGFTAGRSTSLSYSHGNLSSLQTGSLNYNFTYSKGDLTAISKNSARIEEHTHTPTQTNSYYPSQSSPLHSAQYHYDKYGRLTSLAGQLTNSYDLDPTFNASTGAMTAQKNNGSALLGMTTDHLAGETSRYHYDKFGRLIKKEISNQASYASKKQEETIGYDDYSRVATHTVAITNGDSVGSTVAYVADEDGVSVDNRVASYDYKVDGVVRAATDNAFDQYKRLTQKSVTMDGSTMTKAYEYNGVLIQKIADKRGTMNLGTNSYTYDSMGRVKTDAYTSSSCASDNKTYEYDQYGQLVRENNKGLAKTYLYEYNNLGNLTAVKAYSYTTGSVYGTPVTTTLGYTADKLTSFGGTSISYNANGCPTSIDGKTATWTRGRLTRLSSGSLAAGTHSYTYSYNAQGQRTARSYSYLEGTSGLTQVTTGQVTAYSKRYYYDHTGRLISETTQRTLYNTGTDYERIVYLYDESTMVGMDYTLNGSTTRYYFQRNLQGDVTAIFSAQGLAVKYRYDAWGNCTVASETTNINLARANPIRYRGYYYDHDTDLYYCNSRYYSPKWRRFVSPDDTAYLDPESVNGLNLYCYCNNDPVNRKCRTGSAESVQPITIQGGLYFSRGFSRPNAATNTNAAVMRRLSKYHLFGYERRTSAGWEYSTSMICGFLGIIGFSSYITHKEGRLGVLYAFAGTTCDVTSLLDTTYYAGVGIDLFGVMGAEIQVETLGVGVTASVGRFSVEANANLLASTTITFAWDTDLGNGLTRTDGFTVGVNTIGLLALVVSTYLWLTTGFALPSPTPSPIPQPLF